jgi:hypothetical protein
MNYGWRYFSIFLSTIFLCLSLAACGDSPWHFDPGPPGSPSGLTAAPGNGQVALSWSTATNAAAYNVYYATTPGVEKNTSSKISTITSTSSIVTGLTNGVTYYFAVAAINSNSESPLSNEVSATPVAPAAFQQADLQGTWYFNVLSGGTGAAWMRGIAAIDGTGNVTVTMFLNSAGVAVAPAGLFTTMTILPDGTVSQIGSDFHGVLSANQYKDMLVGTASFGGTSPMLAILQKRVPGITYSSSDIKGTGKLVAGPLTFVYHQLSSGGDQEWEYAAGQIGQDQAITYSSINAPSAPVLPGGSGNKAVTLAITADGIISETPIAGALPQPTALLTWGVMSADKMTIIGTATNTSGAYVLRVIQFIHPPSISLTPSTYVLSDLAAHYSFHNLNSGASPLWAYGNLAIDGSGTAAFSSYQDQGGSTVLPAPDALSLDQQGALTISGNSSYNGQLSYFDDMMVATRTNAPGVYSLSIALKR